MVWKYDEMPSLAGKVAIVTGATGGAFIGTGVSSVSMAES